VSGNKQSARTHQAQNTGIIMCLFGFQLDGIHKWINLPSDRWMERTEQMRMIIIKWNMTNYYYSFNGWLNSLTHIGTIPTLDANPHEFNSWFSTLFPGLYFEIIVANHQAYTSRRFQLSFLIFPIFVCFCCFQFVVLPTNSPCRMQTHNEPSNSTGN